MLMDYHKIIEYVGIDVQLSFSVLITAIFKKKSDLAVTI